MKEILRWAAAALVAALAPVLTAQTSFASESQTFQCQRLGRNYYGTVTVKPGRTAQARLIEWRTREFSSLGYTPKFRCSAVTNKLNKAVSDNGGTLSGLWLTIGRVSRYRVICHVNNIRSGCNKDNVLFTLRSTNRRNPSEVLARLLNFSVTGRGNPVQESEGQPYVNLESLVNQLWVLESGTNTPVSSSPDNSASGAIEGGI